MGFFGFFKKRRDKPSKFDPFEESPPRYHHYALAHYVLRSMAFENPLGFLSILASPDAHQFLSSLMESVSEYSKEPEQGPDCTVEEFTIHKARVGGYPCAIIEMPQPRGRAEAFFVAGDGPAPRLEFFIEAIEQLL